MSQPAREIDVLEALGEGVEDLLAAVEATEERSAYLDGQAAFFEAVLAAIPEADPDERPQAVLEGVASEQGLELVDAEPGGLPLDGHEAGLLGAWGLCLGYVEGFHAGGNAVIGTVDEASEALGE
ncbi:hypothetical protein BRD56_04675 [Thermoplasmatales archaeon SW_10_69_26]|nr:MAG: hypothetical protein BRD56_04675 [Thermoplasmatales archaeon SW_10_69_26]